MKITRPDLAALAVCALTVIGIVVLTALHNPVPDVVPTIALISLSAGVGIASQPVFTSGASQAVSEAAAAAVTPTLPAYVPAPAPAPAVEQQPAVAALVR